MPTYDFRCEQCSKLFEARLSFAEADDGKLPACPACGAQYPKRLLSSTINILTGKPDVTITGPGGDEKPGGSCGSSCGCGH